MCALVNFRMSFSAEALLAPGVLLEKRRYEIQKWSNLIRFTDSCHVISDSIISCYWVIANFSDVYICIAFDWANWLIICSRRFYFELLFNPLCLGKCRLRLREEGVARRLAIGNRRLRIHLRRHRRRWWTVGWCRVRAPLRRHLSTAPVVAEDTVLDPQRRIAVVA